MCARIVTKVAGNDVFLRKTKGGGGGRAIVREKSQKMTGTRFWA